MYNVKLVTYPDLTRHVRLYEKPVFTGSDCVDNDDRKIRLVECDPFHFDPVKTVNDFSDLERIEEVSRKRTIDKIYSYVRSNTWEYFVTFTFSPDLVDRYDYSDCSRKMSQWLKNMKKRYCSNLSYLIVPERHKDGAFHFHGLFSNCDGMDIRDSGKRVVKKFKRGTRTCFKCTDEVIYLFGRYKLGWTTATVVKDSLRAGRYVLKYITKDLVANVKGKKRYWVSSNLDFPQIDTFMVDGFDRMILRDELVEDAKYSKVCVCKDYEQVVRIFEFDE